MKATTVILYLALLLTFCVRSTPLKAGWSHVQHASTLLPASNATKGTHAVVASAPRPKAKYPKAGDKAWEDNRQRGCRLVQLMAASDKKAASMFTPPLGNSAASKLLSNQDFIEWGYTDDPSAKQMFDFEEGASPIRAALKALKINDKIDDTKSNIEQPNGIVGWQHTKDTTRNGITYKKTGAKYYTVVNADDGMIVGWWKYGPAHEAPKQNPPVDPAKDPLPDLRRWSDVAYLSYAEQAAKRNKDVANLRYIFSSPVENSEARLIIARAMDSDKEPPLWPGRKEYAMQSDEGKAILGSPNGRGAAMLLIQHKATLGETTHIEKVAVFGEGEDTNLLFYIKPGGRAEPERPEEPEERR